MKTTHRHLLTLLAAASLAACSSVPLDSNAPVESRTGAAVVPGNGTAGRDGAAGTSQTRVASVDVTANNAAAMSNLPHTVYFDFDSYVVKDEYRPVIEANARALSTNRKAHVTVEGNTDDRGSSEYNLALGQRRAESVVKALTLLGAEPNQLEAVSFGKERPAVQGENEEAWAKNRRAELARR
ncbi:MAG: peptidoglycan-associated lipoprotein Pal [Caldimonas sp.]